MDRNKIPEKGFWEEYLSDWGSSRGCAFLGKTGFDKLGVVQNFLKEAGREFAVVDCRETSDADAITDAAKRYREVPYVIFNNCEGILSQDGVLKVFAHILDADEYSIDFPTKSFYVFLGDKNTLCQIEDYSAGSPEADHIASFCSFVQCHDLDTEKRFMGYGFQPA
jgi:hypothetical protein